MVEEKRTASQAALMQMVIMRVDICAECPKMKLLAQEDEHVDLDDNATQEMCKPRTSLDPLSLSNLLHTAYTILLLSSQKVSAFGG